MENNLDPFLNMGVEFDGIVTHLWHIAIAILIIAVVVMWYRKRSLSYLTCFIIFGLYILYTVDKVFFPIVVAGAYTDVMKQVPWSNSINFIPFYFGPYGTLESSLTTLMLNIILTMPFGFGVNFLTRTKPRKIFWMALAVGVGAEATQFIISLFLGYPYRVIDMNDTLMNALGVLIGYAIFRIFACFYLWATGRFGIEFEGLAAYVHDISSQASGQQIHKPTR